MPKTLIATMPNGTVLSRKTDRTYVAMIAALPSYQRAREIAMSNVHRDAANFTYHLAHADGSYRSHWSNSPPTPAEMERSKAELNGCTTPEAYAAMKQAARLAHIEQQKADGYFDTWQSVTWCGRPDLAQKEFAKISGGVWAQVKLFPVTEKPKTKKITNV